MLSLPKAGWIAFRTGEELEAEACACNAIQIPGESDITIAERGRCDHWKILQIICTAVGIAIIIRGWHDSSAATRSQCNPEASVVVNGVAENGPSGVIASKTGDTDAVETVKRDDVALPCIRAADDPITR
jgi:hypothetical protein